MTKMTHEQKVAALLVARRAGLAQASSSHPVDIGCAMQNAIEYAAETLDVLQNGTYAPICEPNSTSSVSQGADLHESAGEGA